MEASSSIVDSSFFQNLIYSGRVGQHLGERLILTKECLEKILKKNLHENHSAGKTETCAD